MHHACMSGPHNTLASPHVHILHELLAANANVKAGYRARVRFNEGLGSGLGLDVGLGLELGLGSG